MPENITVAELFAGVGGFRIGLDYAGGYETIWANQWEPPGTAAKQFAWRCYESHFGKGSCVNRDIHEVLTDTPEIIPDVQMVVGGFPCQDYSVAKSLSDAHGIEGKKGVLWWDIYKFLQLKKPQYCLFENVDRLLKSPAAQRGRDFAIMLSCLNGLGYGVEWRVINSAAYGFPQRRKRVYIYAEYDARWDIDKRLTDGVMSDAFPMRLTSDVQHVTIDKDPYEITQAFPSQKVSPFSDTGCSCDFTTATARIAEEYDGKRRTLGDVIVAASDVPDEYWIPEEQLPQWKYLKGSKRMERTARNGHKYMYSEGSMAYPDLLTNPSRTILTGEGGRGASRFKHIIEQDGRYRRLVPLELERLQGFPDGWTDTDMTDTKRAFCMGNALVVGVVTNIGRAINQRRERLD